MKHKILAVIAVVLVIGLGVVAIQHHRAYVAKQQAVQSAQAKATHDQFVEQSLAITAAVRLKEECQKGVVAYNALPAVTKAKVEAPVCR